MSEVSGSIPVSGLCFLLIFVVFTLCLPCYSSLLSACTVKRCALSMVLKVARFHGMSAFSGSIPVSGLCFLLIFVVYNLNRTNPASITPRIIHMCSLVCIYSRIIHEKT